MRKITIIERPDGIHVEIENIKDKVEGAGLLSCALHQLLANGPDDVKTAPARPMRRIPRAMAEVGADLGPRAEAVIEPEAKQSE